MKNDKRLVWMLPALTLLIVGTIYIMQKEKSMPFQHDEGMIFGTFYSVTYQYDRDLKTEIEQELNMVDASLSMFNKNSVISKLNRNEKVELNEMFITVFDLAKQVSKDTDGAFDITVAPLVNAWGFGFKNDCPPTKHTIDSLMQYVGFDRVYLYAKVIRKDNPNIMIDCSAIAKGYGSDVVASCLRKHGIKNFMVEIGGEVVTAGHNPKNKKWQIGVEKPVDDTLATKSELQTVIEFSDGAMATSGNYRNFYYKDGKKYAHTIDPATGYPVQHNILSATVMAKTCARADAYATAFMVMGLEKAKKVIARNDDLKAYIIYDDHGTLKVWESGK